MCEPVSATLAVMSIAGAAVGFKQASDAADAAEIQQGIARNASIDRQGQLGLRSLQEADAAVQQKDLISREALLASGRSAAGLGGQMGTGASNAALQQETAGQASSGRSVLAKNLTATQGAIKAQQKGIGISHLLQAPITRPSPLGFALQAAVGGASAYSDGLPLDEKYS
jgi:hypothetical protein